MGVPPKADAIAGIFSGTSAETSATYTLPRASSGRRARVAGSSTFRKNSGGTRTPAVRRAREAPTVRHTTGALSVPESAAVRRRPLPTK